MTKATGGILAGTLPRGYLQRSDGCHVGRVGRTLQLTIMRVGVGHGGAGLDDGGVGDT